MTAVASPLSGASIPCPAAACSDRDDADIRALLRGRPVDGRIRVAFTREPDSRIAAAVEGERHATFVARDAAGRLLGFGSRSVRRVYLGGAPCLLGYLGQLRAAAGAFSLRHLRRGYAHLRAERRPDELPFDLTTILADNRPARRLLERGLAGLPLYRPLTEVETLIIPAGRDGRRRRGPAARPIARAERRRLLDFLGGELRRQPFAPLWSDDDLAAEGRAFGLSWDDFRIVEERGEIVATAALWDQRAYKQVLVAGYAGWLAPMRPLINLRLRAEGRPPLPPAGSQLPIAYAACLAVGGDEPRLAGAVVEALLREARRRGLAHVVLSLAAAHPLRQALRRRFPARSYRSILYTVSWPDDPPVDSTAWAGAAPYVEAALL